MKCNEIDIISYIEGNKTRETRDHISSCVKCTKEVEKLEKFVGILSTRYVAGKNLEKELDRKLQTIDISKMKKLPEDIAIRVSALRGKSLTDKLKKVVGRGGKSAKAFLDNIMTPQMHAMPASPKDITKTKEKTKRKKKI